ncbi:glycoside hydrolase family protein [Polymorphum gilvum]|uniref:Lysozyme n=1 Tax=Polymorphum gilvum (strain LMG 25793 / CGMCC 1.9160 / SL003B-26A1) TaxID=991905 RepID=F2J6G6_POLGS|nr:peptidoglycan-binding protein [Polymorphum gilvum]ADZ71340.1 Lysozyme [Polymorphum gilvum SL003B-26A1]
MKTSDEGLGFIARHEGFVATAYRDPAGVLTIGYGFTMGSRIFAGWWRARHGRALAPGDRIGRAQADTVLRALLDGEYGPAVARRFAFLPQHRFDACVSVAYNLGPGALGWRWAAALAAGDVAAAARLLETTGTTAGGRRLAGLVRRRKEEAALLRAGDYGGAGRSVPRRADVQLQDDQRLLASLGYRPGPVDGFDGPRTRAAVMRFQQDHPPLSVDGRIGPATRAALRRALDARAGVRGAGGAAVAGGVAALSGGLSWQGAAACAVAALVLVLLAALAWRHRGRLRPRRAK